MILQAALTAALMCQRATVSSNSGNGPNYRVTVCTALKPPGEDQRWDLIIDGSPLQNGAVIIGVREPA